MIPALDISGYLTGYNLNYLHFLLVPFSHNVCVPVCCLGVLRHSMMLSLWWDCLSSSLTSAASPLSPRTRLSIYRNYTLNIVVNLKEIYTNTKMSLKKYSLQAKKTHTHMQKELKSLLVGNRTICQHARYLNTHTWSSSSSRWESFSDMWCSSSSACLFLCLRYDRGSSKLCSSNLLLLRKTPYSRDTVW